MSRNASPKSPFSESYFDGVSGFFARLLVGGNKDSVSVNLSCSMEPNKPKKWTVLVKVETQELYPNIGCDALYQVSFDVFSNNYFFLIITIPYNLQTSEWKFVLAQSIDLGTFEYEYENEYLVLQAKHKIVEVEEPPKGKKRKINTEFSDRNVKRFRRGLDLNEENAVDTTAENEPSDEQEKEPFFGIFNYLPVEVSFIIPIMEKLNTNVKLIPLKFQIIHHILKFLNDPNEIRKCALVKKSWQMAVQLLNLPAKLTINDSFFTPVKYLEFLEVFQHFEELPFDFINYVSKTTPNVGQIALLNNIMKRGARVKIINVILTFEQYNGRQHCPLLQWLSGFKRCKYVLIRMRDFVAGVPIDYGNCDLSHVKEFHISAVLYEQMQNDLKDRFPLNSSNYKILHAYNDSQLFFDSQ